MNKKKFSLLIFLIMVLTISAVSAADDSSTLAISQDNSTPLEVEVDESPEVLADDEGPSLDFASLQT